MSTNKPKSILKTSLPSAHAASSPLVSSNRQPTKNQPKPTTQGQHSNADPRHMAIALHHAHRIQAQKDTEKLILDRILDLVTYPTSPSADPASPSVEDATTFKTAIVPFQPADYDSLIQERNIEGLCGYGLCPREHRKDGSKGTYRITWGAKGSGQNGRGREMNIVPREKLEMWCSDECAERAMYIRVQLAEEPVWERRAEDTRGQDILLLEEGRALQQDTKGKGKARSTSVSEVAGQLEDLLVDENKRGDKAGNHSRELAMERGDSSAALQAGRVDIQIREKDIEFHGTAEPPLLRAEDHAGGSIEGYIPKDRRGEENEDEEDPDLLDQF